MKLLADVNCPGSQEDVVSHWQPSHSLVEDAVSRGNTAAAPCLPALAVAHLPLCLWGGRALSSSHLVFLSYFPNPLFCDHARVHHVALESFEAKVLFCCFSRDPMVWVGMSHWFPQIVFRAFKPSPYYELMVQPVPPCPVPTCWWWIGASETLLHK